MRGMNKPFFIMLLLPNGATPITKGEDDVYFFTTEEEARELAEDHDACQHFGYEIFELGTGL